MRLFRLLCATTVLSFAPLPLLAAGTVTEAQVVGDYAKQVHAGYTDAYKAAKRMQTAIHALLDTPSAATMKAARTAWLEARDPYSLTEAYRFYDGPIDFADKATGTEGPEGRINAWPVNEAYIDYVLGNPQSGIVQDASVAISMETLMKKNQADDEADVATGYHAIEFLLWGQDVSKDGPGARPYTDFAKGDGIHARRREYLKAVTQLLLDDMQFLVKSWAPGADNYAGKMVAGDSKQALGRILTGLATLSGFELSSERMATALDSGDQEDEHSCFSDNTHRDLISNAKGIAEVYFGRRKGAGLDALLRQRDVKLADAIALQLAVTEKEMASIPHPIDREVLASPAGSNGRQAFERTIASLNKQADLFKQAGAALGADVEIVKE